MKKQKEFELLRAEPDFATRNYSCELEDSFRTKFDRDRDRILYSKEFRRLQGKTQVFINGFDDYIRNRLTHTIEVSQISQSIAGHFGFNRTLAEAISLGHDVGHTPFGHIGERVLNFFTNNCDPYKKFKIEDQNERGFKHNWQGLKVVSTLEKISPNFKGLNLTDYTLWGILHHSGLEYKPCIHKLAITGSQKHQDLLNSDISAMTCKYIHNGKKCHLHEEGLSLSHYDKYKSLINDQSWTFEALIVSHSDEIAQRHHDIEDGLIAGIINQEELVEVFFDSFNTLVTNDQKIILNNIKNTTNQGFVNHDLRSLILSFYSSNLINNTNDNFKKLVKDYEIKTSDDYNKIKTKIKDFSKIVVYDDVFKEKEANFQKYLITRILNSHLAQTMDGKASYILRNLIRAYLTNPKQLPDATITTLMKNYCSEKEFSDLTLNKSSKLVVGILRDHISELHNTDNKNFITALIRTITDFIAGTTDAYALSQYRMLYGSDNYWEK